MDQNASSNRPAGRRNLRRIVVVAAVGGGLALGAAGLAYAADPSAPAPSSSAAPGAPGPSGPPGPAGRPDGTHQPHLVGTVTSITDDRIMITDRDGFTRQINITAKPDGVEVGARIHAEGTVNADKVSLDATSVRVAPQRPAGGPGRPGGPEGHGGPGGFGRHGGPPPSAPTGTPTPSATQ